MIPYSTQCIEPDDIEAVSKALQDEYLTGGSKVAQFEENFAKAVGAKYATAISSGTAALHAACAAINISGGDEVITTPNTWVSSANAALYCGARPVFADIDAKTYNIDPKEIEKKITNKTKAIIAVHYAGQPCDMDEIHRIAKKYNIIVIEDAAHAVEAVYKGKKIGGISDLTTFSFHPVKQMTTCEGGMITTNDSKFYEKLQRFRAYSMVKNSEKGEWFSEQVGLGYNYRLSDVQCALGMSQLKKVAKFVARRREIAAIYDKELKNTEGLILPYQAPESVSSYHLYPVLVPANRRKELYQKMREAGIGVGVHYYPVYKNKYYQEIGYKDVCCPVSEDFYARELTLPVHPKVTDDDVKYIVNTLKKLMEC